MNTAVDVPKHRVDDRSVVLAHSAGFAPVYMRWRRRTPSVGRRQRSVAPHWGVPWPSPSSRLSADEIFEQRQADADGHRALANREIARTAPLSHHTVSQCVKRIYRKLELADLLPIARPGVSRHLRVLGGAGLVDVRRDAQSRIYSLRPEPLAEVEEWVGRYRALWTQRLEALNTEVARGRREWRSNR